MIACQSWLMASYVKAKRWSGLLPSTPLMARLRNMHADTRVEKLTALFFIVKVILLNFIHYLDKSDKGIANLLTEFQQQLWFMSCTQLQRLCFSPRTLLLITKLSSAMFGKWLRLLKCHWEVRVARSVRVSFRGTIEIYASVIRHPKSQSKQTQI